ncbi:MAG: hypothetical protein JW924_14560 [Fusobacteriaceae bacterium]|nr:hypothetical protein [Fusobacteriaceae bacterium]
MATIPLYFLENLQFKKIVQWFLFGILFTVIIGYTLFHNFEESIYMAIVSNPITYFMFSSAYKHVTPEIISDFKEKRYFKLIFYFASVCFYIVLQYIRMKAHLNK